MKLNKEELLIGAIYGLAFTVFWVHYWSAIVSIACSLLWALSGAGKSKLYRRLVCPMIVSLCVAIVRHTWTPLVSVPMVYGVLSIGYGIPSVQPQDDGSYLGRFWSAVSIKHADLLTRGTIYLLLLIAHIPTVL